MLLLMYFTSNSVKVHPINLSGEEKAAILAWKAENFPTKETAGRTGHEESAIRAFMAVVRGLLPGKIPPTLTSSRRRGKTFKKTDTLLKQKTGEKLKSYHQKTREKASSTARGSG